MGSTGQTELTGTIRLGGYTVTGSYASMVGCATCVTHAEGPLSVNGANDHLRSTSRVPCGTDGRSNFVNRSFIEIKTIGLGKRV